MEISKTKELKKTLEDVLAKKTPLGTIWVAAHMQQMRKRQIVATDINPTSTVDVNLPEDAPHAPFHSVALPETFELDDFIIGIAFKTILVHFVRKVCTKWSLNHPQPVWSVAKSSCVVLKGYGLIDVQKEVPYGDGHYFEIDQETFKSSILRSYPFDMIAGLHVYM
ncbi:hypothetical protein NE237_008436 [Protea cynaroides]|uniref:Rad21/Rec8-like protein N-terminal domain-containing protein n=1 Tax=Protea cynaroides TaxID=273540 RepID=A0A9Q0KWH4_9MAGN|nr:hypothetical protein NE237_008436 [Protea cynaroides]